MIAIRLRRVSSDSCASTSLPGPIFARLAKNARPFDQLSLADFSLSGRSLRVEMPLDRLDSQLRSARGALLGIGGDFRAVGRFEFGQANLNEAADGIRACRLILPGPIV
jgi:hypothetical protein